MKIKNKYVTGTQVMFYEIEMFNDTISGIINTLKLVDNRENLSYHFTFNMSEAFELIDTSKISREELKSKFVFQIERLKSNGVNVKYDILEGKEPYSMANYRRDFNYLNCTTNDILIWGETDCYMPAETFPILDQIHEYSASQNVWKYVVTFAIRKMWDSSWSVLEHPLFENCKYYEKTEPKCFTEQSSIRYVMSIEEMNEINSKTKDLDIRILTSPRFDGSGATFSTDLIKAGANIPLAAFGIASDDTFMMEACRKTMGNQYVQYVIKNLLKVHNREHPRKRNYALNIQGQESTQSKKGDWYKVIRNTNEQNLHMYSQTNQNRFFTYQDCLNTLQ